MLLKIRGFCPALTIAVTLILTGCGGSSSAANNSTSEPLPETAADTQITISTPQPGAILSYGEVSISGAASNADSISISIDEATPVLLTGDPSWSYNPEANLLPPGVHTIDVTATGDGSEATERITIEVIGPRMSLKNHVGSLYAPFSWAGARRDPLNRILEIADSSSYVPLSLQTLTDLETLLTEAEVIAQIGGMGSAKIDQSTPDAVHPRFEAYMNAFAADGGLAWREAVRDRAMEVANVVAQDNRFFWQIGNEISATSYSHNIHTYFQDGLDARPFDQSIIPVFVEWFFAPTVQALEDVSKSSEYPVRIALGSITSFANAEARAFLDALLNYEIQGDYASELSGRRVSEFVDILTVHYMMNGVAPFEVDYWRDILGSVRDDWYDVGRIRGLWNTEEIGIRAATDGKGAAAALTISARYLSWISENELSASQAQWFYFGANDGPQGQRAADSMSKLASFIDENEISLALSAQHADPEIETYMYRIPDTGAAFAILTNRGADTVTLNSAPTLFPPSTPLVQTTSATAYNTSATSELSVYDRQEDGGARILFTAPVELESGGVILILFPS